MAGRIGSAIDDLVDAGRYGDGNDMATAISEVTERLIGVRPAEVDLLDHDAAEPTRHREESPVIADRGGTVVSLLDEDRVVGRIRFHRPPPSSEEMEAVWRLAAHLIGESRAHDHLTELVAQLDRALRTRLRIEQAKGVMAERLGVAPDDAFAQLRASARSEHRTVDAVARDVLATLEQKERSHPRGIHPRESHRRGG